MPQGTVTARPPARQAQRPAVGDAGSIGRVGQYVLDRQLGAGSTATIWLGHRARSRRKVCIKVLHPHLARDPVARARLEAEAAAARVSHPGVVSVVDVHFTDTEAALVFPYVAGETLAARLARDGSSDPRTAARIAADVAAALMAVHGRGVVHRDVKPSNILLGRDGSARLVDFGIAHPLSTPVDTLTGHGMTIGTLPYMAPEQLAGLPPRAETDVFALGVVLYEMLSGRRPFEANTPDELARAHATPPADVPEAPRPLFALAWAALARDADVRPSATVLRDGLLAWLDDGALPVPPLAASRMRRFRLPARAPRQAAAPMQPAAGTGRGRRHRTLAGAGIGFVALTVASAIAFSSDPAKPYGGQLDDAHLLEDKSAAATRSAVMGTIGGILDRLVTTVGDAFGGGATTDAGAREAAVEPDSDAAPAAGENDDDDDDGKKRGRNRGRGDDDDD